MYVSPEMVNKARSADLYQYLINNHGERFRREGNSLRMRDCNGVSIRNGYYGYTNFSSGDTGNGIDFLMKYLDYSFQEAVTALSDMESIPSKEKTVINAVTTPLELPEPAPFPHARMFAFLIKRGIPKQTISALASKGLIYQSAENGNIVFVNKERDYCELRGTYTFAERPFHGCLKKRPDRFWYFKGSDSRPETAYVTEAAIDAISLYLLQKAQGSSTDKSVYISIGGASNHQTINRIKRGIRTILAVDNDSAGQACRDYHSDLEFILPAHKDWNEDLQCMNDQ